MTFSVNLFRGVLLLLAGLLLSGCVPSAQSQLDEEKEPHFLAGKSRVSTLDYSGAIECFEKALEVNPQSASAHFELACLFEQKQADPTAAIYHYDRYLKLRPRAENGEIIRQRIMGCKQELARTVSLGPVTEKARQELEQVAQENKRLTEDVKKLKDELEQWKLAAKAQTPSNSLSRTTAPVRSSTQPQTSLVAGTNPGAISKPPPSTTTRTHTVQRGETPSMIARRYGIRLDALLTANPKLNDRRLQVGQILSIPSP